MDETELSFIRCPNCRSLVPAVASRCRMCGFILKDASSKQSPNGSDLSKQDEVGNVDSSLEDDSSEERPSRVRQRTISVSGNSNFTSSILEAIPEKQSPPSHSFAQPAVPPEDNIPSAQDISADEQSSYDELEETSEEDFDYDEDSNGTGIQAGSAEIAAAPESDLIKKKRRRRRRRKKPAGAGEAGSNPPTPLQVPVDSIPEVRQEPVFKSVQAPPAQPVEEGIAPWRTPPLNNESKPSSRIDKQPEQVAPVPVEAKEKVETQRIQEPKQAVVEGSLVGWLVSYAEDKKGVSHELRDGRFFVGREQLRPSDFVIDHRTVSTPQCLVVCDPVSGVSVQDLMSEGGTTLIRGSSALAKSSEQVRLENGDRIRFGEYEMLFVKLP